jgi:superfamily II DNA or RNA helicase
MLVHNCHRVAAPTFAAAIEKFNSLYRVGLTATPRRGDKMEDVFHWHLGEVEAVGRGKFLDCSVYVIEWDPLLKPGQWQFRGRPNLGKLITALSKEDARTDMIVRLIAKAARAGRKILFLSDRVAHLDEIRNRLQKMFRLAGESYSVGIFGAGTTKKVQAARKFALEADIMGGTWAMASEGLDSPERDTIFFATPKADVEQACGRIRRLYDGKKQPLIVDVHDNIAFLGRFARKRQRYYRNSGTDKSPWPVKVVSRIAS